MRGDQGLLRVGNVLPPINQHDCECQNSSTGDVTVPTAREIKIAAAP
jgi:hypothetical protein